VSTSREILLIRHGTTDANLIRSFTGKGDIPLNEQGMQEAAALRFRSELRGADRYWSSPMLRVRQTAGQALGAELPLHIDERLREADFGDWEGRIFDDIVATETEAVARWRRGDADFAFPGGESIHDFFVRTSQAADAILATPGEGHIVVFTHGGVIRSLVSYWLGLGRLHFFRFEARNTSVTRLKVYPDSYGALVTLNDCTHLDHAKAG